MLFLNDHKLKIIRTSMLQRYSPYWFLWKLVKKIFKSDLGALPLCAYYGIDVVSHSDFAKVPMIKIINWIPDFQHTHLPEMFRTAELNLIDQHHSRCINGADRVVVSSESAANDLIRLYPKSKGKIFILRFTSQVPDSYWDNDEVGWESIAEQYHLKNKFFYVPNQFYNHKNHLLLVDALVVLKARGVDIQIICSGAIEDPRDPTYFTKLEQYINAKNCTNSLRVLGIIPYKDVLSLIKFSIAVINPSRFEGWSTVVEECKSIGKKIILSDIAVHREQIPSALFFGVDNSIRLADLLEDLWNNRFAVEDNDLAGNLKNNKQSMLNFGEKYIQLVESVL
jgi:glycosyltransferase involved in cell wall biosynthesis